MTQPQPRISPSWTGQDGQVYRDIRFWVGAGWSNGFLQRQDDLGNWTTLY